MSVIQTNILRLAPTMKESRAHEFASYIFDASTKYQIDPAVLVAISFQESSFRENLPEGAAGEVGVCQVLKSWIADARFKREFGRLTIAKLAATRFNYIAAAWILAQVRDQYGDDVAPFWSYYNSATLRHRVAYFKRVAKHLAKLSMYDGREYRPRKSFSNGGKNEDEVLPGYLPKIQRPRSLDAGTSRDSGPREWIAVGCQSLPPRPPRVQRG